MSILEKAKTLLYDVEWTPRLYMVGITYGIYLIDVSYFSKANNEDKIKKAEPDQFTHVKTLKSRLLSFIMVTSFVAYYLKYTYPKKTPKDSLNLRETVGMSLLIFGTLLRQYSKYIMGRHFTYDVTILNDHQIIDYGPYKFVRHPGYTGAIFHAVGLALFYNNFFTYGSAFHMVSGLYKRVDKEEQFLLDHFDDDYIEYKNNVKSKLIPFIY